MSSFCLPRADWSYMPEDDDQRPDVALEKLPPSPTSVEDNKPGTEGGLTVSSTSSETVGRNSTDNAADGGDDLSRRTGDVQTYLYYIRSVGWWATFLFVVAISGFAFCLSFPGKWSPCCPLSSLIHAGTSFTDSKINSHLGGMVGRLQRGQSQWKSGILARHICHAWRRCSRLLDP